jgi:hypothetical protein
MCYSDGSNEICIWCETARRFNVPKSLKRRISGKLQLYIYIYIYIYIHTHTHTHTHVCAGQQRAYPLKWETAATCIPNEEINYLLLHVTFGRNVSCVWRYIHSSTNMTFELNCCTIAIDASSHSGLAGKASWKLPLRQMRTSLTLVLINCLCDRWEQA